MSVRRAMGENSKSNNGKFCCTKHSDRVATHQLFNTCNIANTAELLYCEKCSIMLASQGLNVVKLNPISKRRMSSTTGREANRKYEPKISNRKSQIQAFLSTLDEAVSNMKQESENLQEYLIRSEYEYGNIIEAVNCFYKEIEEILELQKYTTYNSILNRRAAQEADARILKDTVEEYIEELMNMMDDISQNMDAVESVDFPVYSTIMNGYKAKLNGMSDIKQEIPQVKSLSKNWVNLPEIPKMLYSIADKITISSQKSTVTTHHNSFNNYMCPKKIVAEEHEMQESGEFSSGNEHIEQSSFYVAQSSGHHQARKNQIVGGGGDEKQLAFSFDENIDTSKQMSGLQLHFEEASSQNSNFLMIHSSRYGDMSKIEEKMNSKEVMESRESLGGYLNCSSSRNQNSIQETDTLLIA